MACINRVVLVAVSMALVSVGSARAGLIKYVTKGDGSVKVGSGSPVDVSFKVTILADTDDVQEFSFYSAVNNLSVALRFGSTTATATAGSSYAFRSGDFVYVDVLVGEDWDAALFDLRNPAYATFDLKSPIGPLTSDPEPYALAFATNLGFVWISSVRNTVFTARAVPEPSSVVLAGMGAAALGFQLARKRRHALGAGSSG
jgi:hypothetical protein